MEVNQQSDIQPPVDRLSRIEKLSTKLAFKEIRSYEISGKIEENGMLCQTLDIEQKFNKDASHFIYLQTLESSSLINNVKKDYNDKFYYNLDGVDKIITVIPGGYELSEYFKALEIDDKKIKFEISIQTGRCIIIISDNCSVDFTKDHTLKAQLGFDSVVLLPGRNISSRTCNVQLTQKIYVDCNLCIGAYRNNVPTQILYSWPNELRYGALITERPKFPRKKELVLKSFHEIRLYFYDQNHNPIDFGGEIVTIELCIEQC